MLRIHGQHWIHAGRRGGNDNVVIVGRLCLLPVIGLTQFGHIHILKVKRGSLGILPVTAARHRLTVYVQCCLGSWCWLFLFYL